MSRLNLYLSFAIGTLAFAYIVLFWALVGWLVLGVVL